MTSTQLLNTVKSHSLVNLWCKNTANISVVWSHYDERPIKQDTAIHTCTVSFKLACSIWHYAVCKFRDQYFLHWLYFVRDMRNSLVYRQKCKNQYASWYTYFLLWLNLVLNPHSSLFQVHIAILIYQLVIVEILCEVFIVFYPKTFWCQMFVIRISVLMFSEVCCNMILHLTSLLFFAPMMNRVHYVCAIYYTKHAKLCTVSTSQNLTYYNTPL